MLSLNGIVFRSSDASTLPVLGSSKIYLSRAPGQREKIMAYLFNTLAWSKKPVDESRARHINKNVSRIYTETNSHDRRHIFCPKTRITLGYFSPAAAASSEKIFMGNVLLSNEELIGWSWCFLWRQQFIWVLTIKLLYKLRPSWRTWGKEMAAFRVSVWVSRERNCQWMSST